MNPPSSSVTQIAFDIPGSEGPLVTPNGRIFVVAPSVGAILEIAPGGRKTVLAQTGGAPAGLQLHRDGSLWVADMKRGILRVTLDGAVSEEVTAFEGQRLRGCNDCSFDSEGHLYFTAPAGSSATKPFGELFCRLNSGEVIRLDAGFAFCNGLAISTDDRLLIVAETFTKKLHGYRLDGPGKVREKFLFATLPDVSSVGPDGIDFDERGRLLVTHYGAARLEVYASDGAREFGFPLPFDKPSNVHFAGPGSRRLLITEHTHHGVWETEWDCAGQTQFGWRN
jgi:gluconolactonase